MINKQKLWFLTLFSIILVLSVYYIAMDNETLNKITNYNTTSSNNYTINEEDTLSALRIQDDDEDLKVISELQNILLDENGNIEEKNNAYDKLQEINNIKSKEQKLENIILNTYNLKTFIKIKDDQINVTISSKSNSITEANNIIRTIQKEFKDQKYVTVKYQ